MYVFAGTPNMYSNPKLLMTSTMKSEPGRSIVFASSTTKAAGAAAGRARTGALAFLGESQLEVTVGQRAALIESPVLALDE